MKLPIQKLIAVLGRSDANFTSGGKNRLAGRIPLTLRATLCTFCRQIVGPEIAVEISDLSVAGIGIVSSEKMLTGEQFLLRIDRDETTVLEVQCVVKRCRKAAKRFSIGAEYIRVIESEKLAS